MLVIIHITHANDPSVMPQRETPHLLLIYKGLLPSWAELRALLAVVPSNNLYIKTVFFGDTGLIKERT